MAVNWNYFSITVTGALLTSSPRTFIKADFSTGNSTTLLLRDTTTFDLVSLAYTTGLVLVGGGLALHKLNKKKT